ncbi:hypothetical protein [Streptomyces sp. NPDC001389]|uniref:hypothetical protein n=1 Tax=Streptomyces sp. NPDC001389 TaxID=3364569 RepID=UPI0036C98B57
MRESYDEGQAAGRLRVPLAAWRWAVGSGLVPPADAGPGMWSRAVVETADPEQVRAALRGPIGAGVAADRLTEALGVPLPLRRPRVTAAAVGHLLKAGLLVYLGGDAEFPDVHPDQVAALGRRRDLPALLDQHVPLGPDQAARRLGVRRTEFDLIVGRLGWLSPVTSVDVDYKHHGGVTTVPLYDAREIALLEVVRPYVDWRAVRTITAGRRSPLAALDPVDEEADRVLLAEVARMARVGRAAVACWRRRHSDFPAPAGGTHVHPEFDRRAVVAWLLAHAKIAVPAGAPTASLVVALSGGRTHRFRIEDPHLLLTDDAEGEDRLSGWSTEEDAEALHGLTGREWGASVRRLTVPGTRPLAVLGDVRLVERSRPGPGGLHVTLSWPAGLRGAATEGSAGVARHGVPYVRPGQECACRRQDCGGLVVAVWCEEHGGIAPAMEWHVGGGIRCTALHRRRARAERAGTAADWSELTEAAGQPEVPTYI